MASWFNEFRFRTLQNMRHLIVALGALLCWGIAHSQVDSALVWPQPPDKPRIRFVETISSTQPFKKESGGLFSKIAGFLFGDNQDHTSIVQPVGIGVGTEGVIYVTDPGAHGIHVFNRVTKEYDFISETKLGKFRSPVGIAIAPDRTMYVSDSERGDIMVFNEDRDAQYSFKDNLMRPAGMAIVSGRLYVADPGRQKIVMFDLKGRYIGEFGQRGNGDGEFNFPIALAVSKSLYVVDALNYRIQEFDSVGKALFKFGRQGNAGGSFSSPKSVALDSDGNIYVSDALMDNFQIFNKSGELLLVVGKQGDANGRFMSPGGIAIDRNNEIYIVDMLNKRVQIFQYLK